MRSLSRLDHTASSPATLTTAMSSAKGTTSVTVRGLALRRAGGHGQAPRGRAAPAADQASRLTGTEPIGAPRSAGALPRPGTGPGAGRTPSVSHSRQVQRSTGRPAPSRRSPARTRPARSASCSCSSLVRTCMARVELAGPSAGDPAGRPAAGGGQPHRGAAAVAAGHPTYLAGRLEPVDQAHRAGVGQAEHLPEQVDARVRRQDVHQRGQCRRAALGLGGGVLDGVGHPVGQDQGQRAEDVGRPGRVGAVRRGSSQG